MPQDGAPLLSPDGAYLLAGSLMRGLDSSEMKRLPGFTLSRMMRRK